MIDLLVSQLIENHRTFQRCFIFKSCCLASNGPLLPIVKPFIIFIDFPVFSLQSLFQSWSLLKSQTPLSPPLLLSRYICLFLGKRKRETEVWYKRKEVRWVSEYTSCFLPCNLGRDTAQALRRYFCVSETRDLRCDRMTNYPGLPGTKDLPGKWTLNVKTRKAPEKPR